MVSTLYSHNEADFIGYRISGSFGNGKRFKAVQRNSFRGALMVSEHLDKHSIWALRKDGTKKLIKRQI